MSISLGSIFALLLPETEPTASLAPQRVCSGGEKSNEDRAIANKA